MLNTSHFRHQATGTKNKCIDRVYIKVIDCRIRDRMIKMIMNRPLGYIHTPFIHLIFEFYSRNSLNQLSLFYL